MSPPEFLLVLGGFLTAIVGGYGAIRLINVGVHRLSGRATTATAEELEELRARVHDLETVRMAELEERVDFAERLLAQGGETARLPHADRAD